MNDNVLIQVNDLKKYYDGGEIKARAKRLAVRGGDVAGDAASGRDFHLVSFPAAWYNGFAAFVRRCVRGGCPASTGNACGAFSLHKVFLCFDGQIIAHNSFLCQYPMRGK